LQDTLDGDLAWRRKELHVYKTSVERAEAAKKQALLRGAIAVLYAHWEGFVRMAIQSYLEFVRQRRLKLGELSACFVALAAKARLHTMNQTTKAKLHVAFVEWMFAELDKRAQLPHGSSLRTRGNLSVEVFQNILNAVGLPYRGEYALAEKPIMERLLELRNELAHGEWQTVDEADFEQLYAEIEKLMVTLRDEVGNAAALGSFKKQ
jgi:hypothetical protein